MLKPLANSSLIVDGSLSTWFLDLFAGFELNMYGPSESRGLALSDNNLCNGNPPKLKENRHLIYQPWFIFDTAYSFPLSALRFTSLVYRQLMWRAEL